MSDIEDTSLSSSPVTPPPPPSAKPKAAPKSSKASKKVTLHLRSELLSKFPSAQPPRKASRSKPAISATPDSEAKHAAEANNNSDNSEQNDTSAAPEVKAEETDPNSATNGVKRKGIPGPKPGAKRTAPGNGVDANGVPKPRGKPGPKKKLKLDGEGGTGAATTQKLGPKANQGAINAGLRALDRSGAKCRRWNKTGFQLKTFTGSTWTLPTWYTIKLPETNGEGNSDVNGSSDAKPENVSSLIESEKSNSGGDGGSTAVHQTDIASSPAPNGRVIEASAA